MCFGVLAASAAGTAIGKWTRVLRAVDFALRRQSVAKRNRFRAHRSPQSCRAGLSALRTAAPSGVVRGASFAHGQPRQLRGARSTSPCRPRGDLAVCGHDAHGSGRLGPASAAGEAAADVLLAQGPAQRPPRVPRRRAVRGELPARAGRPGGVLDLPGRASATPASTRGCCTSSMPAAAWPWEH